jgi:hypothetical protein
LECGEPSSFTRMANEVSDEVVGFGPIVSPEIRWDETLAIRCISAELGVEVVVHDDGTEPSMFDLSIMYEDRAPGAVE